MNSISGGKLCRLCKQQKSLDSFPKNKSQKDGLHYYCKSCAKNIRDANKEDNPDYYNNYREKNREKLRKYHKDYRIKAVIDDSKQLSKMEQAKERKRARQREKTQNPDYIQSRRNYFRHKYLVDEQFRLKKQFVLVP